MAERIKTIVIVSILALVVWLFAEAESLGEDEVGARIEFPQSPTAPLLIRSNSRTPAVKVGMRGGRAALQRAAAILETPLRLEPGRSIPDSDGRHVIDLAEALRRHQPLAETRVTIEYVQPPTIEVTIESLETVSVPIQADLPDVQTEGPITITPPEAEVRLPRSLAERLSPSVVLRARPTPEEMNEAMGPGAHAINATPQLPASLQARPGVSLQTDRVRLEFTVVSTLVTEPFPAVPVQVLLAPSEASEWTVSVDDQDQILSVEITGPRAVMTDLKSTDGNASIVAVLSLSDLELQSDITSKKVGFALLREGVLQNLPREVTVRADRSEVRFSAQRVTEP